MQNIEKPPRFACLVQFSIPAARSRIPATSITLKTTPRRGGFSLSYYSTMLDITSSIVSFVVCIDNLIQYY